MATFDLDQDRIRHLKRNPWTDYLFRPAVITIMIMCLAISVVNLVRLINPSWNGSYFLAGILVATVEAIYSYRLLQKAPRWRISVFRYRLAELIMLALILKLLDFAGMTSAQFVAELQAVWQEPAQLMNLEFMVLFVLAMVAWSVATDTVGDFESLYDIFTDSSITVSHLRHRFLWGGVVLVLISGLGQTIIVSGFSSLANLNRPTLGGILVNVLIYFMLGLVLMSQVNLTRLTVRWHLQDISTKPGLPGNWARAGLIFLGLITVVAFMLPTHYTMGFLEVAGRIIGGIIMIIVLFYYLLLLIIPLLAYLLYSIFGGSESTDTILEPLPPPPSRESGPPSAPWPWLELLQSLFFWLVALAVIVYMGKLYLEDHPEMISQLKNVKLIGSIWERLAQLWHALTHWSRQTFNKLPRGVKQLLPHRKSSPANQGWSWLMRRNMDPRHRILAYYLNILKRAEKIGPARQAHQTPFEYEPELERTIPETQADFRQLTEAFVRARYSQESFDQNQASLIKQYWQRLKRVLAHKQPRSQPPKNEDIVK